MVFSLHVSFPCNIKESAGNANYCSPNEIRQRVWSDSSVQTYWQKKFYSMWCDMWPYQSRLVLAQNWAIVLLKQVIFLPVVWYCYDFKRLSQQLNKYERANFQNSNVCIRLFLLILIHHRNVHTYTTWKDAWIKCKKGLLKTQNFKV